MQGLEVVGTIPDEVLLACGRSDAVPTVWWTPSLVDRAEQDIAMLRSSVASSLDTTGARDPVCGRLTGPLGAVADVVADATVLLLLETEHRNGGVERRSVVVAPDRALLDLHGDGVHDLLLAIPAAACMLLADLLVGDELPVPTEAVEALVGVRSPEEVERALPGRRRTTTTRILRTAVGDEPDDAVAHMVTVVRHRRGLVACWGLPSGAVSVQVLGDLEAVGELAMILLGAVGDGASS